MSNLGYGMEMKLERTAFTDALGRVTDALKEEGFGVLTEIDVRGTLKKKLDVDFRPYAILGACNPDLARRALEVEPHIGLLLPCNVVVQETPEGDAIVSIMDPKMMFQLVRNPALDTVVKEADERLRRVMEALA